MKAASVMLLSNAATFASIAFVPAYAKEALGATALQVGVVVGFYNFALLLSSFALGRWADMHGRRIVLLTGLLASSGAILTQIVAHDAATLALSRGLVGFACGAYPAALLTYAHETKRKIGKFVSYGSLGWGVGSLAAGLLAVYWQIFALSSVLFLLGFLIALALPFGEELLVSVPRLPLGILRKNLPIYATMLTRHAGANAVWVLFAPYMIEVLRFDLTQVGMIYAVNPVFQFIVMQTSDRFKSVHLVFIGLVFSALAFFAMSLAGSFPEMAATQLLIGIGWGAMYVGSVKFVIERNVERATATGLLSSTIGVSAIIGPLIGGSLVTLSLGVGLPQDYAYRTTFYTASLMSVAAIVILACILRRRSNAGSAS